MSLRVMTATLCALGSMLTVGSANADELFINTVSVHFADKQPDNNINAGALYLFNNRAVGGAFYNTHKKMSFFAGYYTPIMSWSTRVGRYKLVPGFIAGGATGYQGGVTPGAVPTLTLGVSDRFDLNLTITPIKGGVTSLAFGFKL